MIGLDIDVIYVCGVCAMPRLPRVSYCCRDMQAPPTPLLWTSKRCVYVYIDIASCVCICELGEQLCADLLPQQMGNDSRLVAVFGRDAVGHQLKRSILTQDAQACVQLKAVINKVLGVVSPEGL